MMEITTEKFQGPLGILLKLIEQEEMDITEIALAKIADEYLAYIETAGNIGPEEMADFLVIAAKLLFIKSKALLPYLVSAEEEEEITELEGRLRMYKEFIEASVKIAELIGAKKFLFSPLVLNKNFRRFKAATPAFNAPNNLDSALLNEKFLALLGRLMVKEETLDEKKLEPKISIDERIDHIRKLLAQKLRFSFSQFLKGAQSKTEVIVSFLAVLELAKQRELLFEQGELFSEIHVLFRDDKDDSENNLSN
ncbi:MAG: segregation/condensation protein A [Patescibacteria group bacterium]